MTTASADSSSVKFKRALTYAKRNWTLYLLLILPVAFFIIFRYVPMTYLQIAFKKYSIIENIWTMPLAKNNGFEFFIKAFSNRDFLYAVRNTFTLNFLDLIIGFPAPIILAILLNELAFDKFKRVTQTVVYMPHFLSWIIIYGISTQLFATSTGMVNILLNNMGFSSVSFLDNSFNWVVMYIFVGVWQSFGWNAIIYLAALTNINPELFEAASVDGASRFRKIWHITLPGIRPTIITMLILNLGRILSSDFDRPYAFANKLVMDVGNVISTFVYKAGIQSLQFSLAAAVGLFQSIVCVVFLIAANSLAEKFGERGIW